MKDNTLIVTGAMPNAANAVATNLITAPQQIKRPYSTSFRVKLSNTVATGANSKNINYALWGTNGNAESNGGNATLIGSFVVAGNGTAHPVSNREIALPPNLDKLKLYATATGEANGGDAGDGTFTLEVIV